MKPLSRHFLSLRAEFFCIDPFLKLVIALALILPSSAFADAFQEPLESLSKVEAKHVVRFRVQSIPDPQKTPSTEGQSGDHQAYKLILETRGGFKVYHKGLQFKHRTLTGQEIDLSFTSDPPPKREFDHWYQEDRETHSNGALFAVLPEIALADQDLIRIRFEACSVNTCLLPIWFEVLPFVGQVTTQAERSSRGEADFSQILGESGTPPPLQSQSPQKQLPLQEGNSASLADTSESVGPAEPSLALSWTDQISLAVQKGLQERSLWLFPALFLAGLLMNLTPCVYPMIPITLNVLGRLGNRGDESREKGFEGPLRAVLYVLGIVITYSAMGVLAGMTGTIFGSLLQNPFVLLGLAVLFVYLALGMLGKVDFTRLQTLGNRIPISEKSPHLGVFTMGAVSGLVSAPCTGPVLSAILVLIGQSKDPLYGLSLMAFFSSGFGFPYLILGIFAHNLRRLPKAGALMDGTKVVFASLLFGLAGYYLKPLLSRIEGTEFLFYAPSGTFAAFVSLAVVTSWLAAKTVMRPSAQRVFRAGVIILLSLLSFWFSLYVTRGFTQPPRIFVTDSSGEKVGKVGKVPDKVGVIWQEDWRRAVQLAELEGKGLLVDAWAEWCAACLKMDAELWLLPEVAERVHADFIPLKLDFTSSSAFTDEIADRWDISALPAIAVFVKGSDFAGNPDHLFRQEVKKQELFAVLNQLRGRDQ